MNDMEEKFQKLTHNLFRSLSQNLRKQRRRVRGTRGGHCFLEVREVRWRSFARQIAPKKIVCEFLKFLKNWKPSPHLSTADQIFFVKRLSFLIRADIPILESLVMIRGQTTSKKFTRALDAIIDDISEGHSLAKSLEKFHTLFSDFAVHIIDFGEQSGTLSTNLEYLAVEMNKRKILSRKILSAFAYPAIVTLATLGITAFLVMYLFPKIMPVFTSLHIKLPITTRIVIWLSNFIRADFIFIVLFVFVAVVAYVTARKKFLTFRLHTDSACLKIPLIGTIIQEYNLANITRTLGLLLQSGATLSGAIPIVVKTATNSVYKKGLADIAPVIDRGEKMSAYFETRRKLFPDIFTQIVSVGERSGNLSNSLLYLSTLYEEQVDEYTKNISTLIEPVLMVVMGVVVGFIAVSIITPIYGITQNLHP